MALLGCNSDPVKNCSNCADEKSNRVIHVAFIKRGTTIAKNASTIISEILAAELACNAYLIRNVNGEYDGGTFSDRPGRGKQDTGNGPGVHNVTYTDSNSLTNRDFYNGMKNVGSNYYMIFFTPEVAHFAEAPLRVMPKGAITRDINTYQEGEMMVRWTYKDLPAVVLGVDDDGLEACPELFTFDADYLYNQSGADATVISGDEITITSGDDIDVRYDTYVDIESVSLDDSSDALPDGLELSSSGNAIIISGTTTETGTYTIQIVGQNACGVSGVVPVTLIVV